MSNLIDKFIRCWNREIFHPVSKHVPDIFAIQFTDYIPYLERTRIL